MGIISGFEYEPSKEEGRDLDERVSSEYVTAKLVGESESFEVSPMEGYAKEKGSKR